MLVLAEVCKEWGEANAKGGCCVVDQKLHQRGELWPVVLLVIDEGTQDVCNDTVDPLYLACSVVVLQQPKNEGGAQSAVQGCPKLSSESAVQIRYNGIGEANVEENRGDKVASSHLQRGRLEG